MNRDDLIENVEEILMHHRDDWGEAATAVLGAILPQVTTVEELEALPVGTVVHSEAGTIACRSDQKRGVLFGDERSFAWSVLALPLTVVWQLDPKEPS